MQKAIFAAGCFWGVQFYFDQIEGVSTSRVGYIGGHTKNPAYEDICYKNTGHVEALELTYDEATVSYETLVKQFLYMHDPTQVDGQGPDVGDQYRSAIFYTNVEQKNVAALVIHNAQPNYKLPIATQLVPATTFYPAEDYHQNFATRTGRGACHRPYKKL